MNEPISDYTKSIRAAWGMRIREARRAKTMTQKQLGQRLKLPRSAVTISYMERGYAHVDVELLEEIATILDRPLSWFQEI